MEYKIGDKVIVKSLGSVWTIRFIDGQAYFLSQGNKSMWVNECGIEPATPRESRKELKARIKELEEQLQVAENMPLPVKDRQIEELQKQVAEMEQYKHHVGILRSRLSITENQRSKLEEKISKLEKQLLAYDISKLPADAQEAVRIVEALEKMQSDFILSRSPINNYWCVIGIMTLVNQGSYPTIAQALQAAGLMEKKEEQR